MPQILPRYYKVNTSDNPIKLRIDRKAFDIVLIVPFNQPSHLIGQFFQNFIEFKESFCSSKSVLLIWMTGSKKSNDISPIGAFWNYFLSKKDFPNKDLYIVEVNFTSKKVPWSKKLQLVFNFLNSINFSYGTIYTPSKSVIPCAYKTNLLIESCRINNTDLNLASYVIPYYKGILINFWMMPLCYLFGRQIRNPCPPDFAFSKSCFNFWLKLKWPNLKHLASCYLFLTLSTIPSGKRINDFFMGEKDFDTNYGLDEIAEIIKTGLNLISTHEIFIRNSTSLLPTHNSVQSSIPFHIYSASDLNDILQSYDKCKSFLGRKFDMFLKNHLQKETFNMINVLLKNLPVNANAFIDYGESWNFILLSLFHEYAVKKSLIKRKKIIEILIHLFSIKPKLWSEQIKKMVKFTKDQAKLDEKRGFPWVGGEAGQNWHIHDNFEKKLHQDLTRMFAIKNQYF